MPRFSASEKDLPETWKAGPGLTASGGTLLAIPGARVRESRDGRGHDDGQPAAG
jgi:hypothetical protein